MAVLLFSAACVSRKDEFLAFWPEDLQSTWVGPELWTNRLQDWRIAGGPLDCVESSIQKPMQDLISLEALRDNPKKQTILFP